MAGGFLGIGKQKALVAVDAVSDVDDTVHIDTGRERVTGPHPAAGYYGDAPYRVAGYLNPGFPYRPR